MGTLIPDAQDRGERPCVRFVGTRKAIQPVVPLRKDAMPARSAGPLARDDAIHRPHAVSFYANLRSCFHEYHTSSWPTRCETGPVANDGWPSSQHVALTAGGARAEAGLGDPPRRGSVGPILAGCPD